MGRWEGLKGCRVAGFQGNKVKKWECWENGKMEILELNQ
jgi:hypothetical protein